MNECELFERCRMAATQAHRIHLVGVDSGYHHVLLDEFYHGIVDKADAFMESWLGRNPGCSVKDFPKIVDSRPATAKAVVFHLRAWIDDNRAKMSKLSELQNQIDEIVSFCDSVLYKLTYLK